MPRTFGPSSPETTTAEELLLHCVQPEVRCFSFFRPPLLRILLQLDHLHIQSSGSHSHCSPDFTANPSNPASTFTPPSVKPNKPAFQRPEPSSTPPRKSQPGCPACGQNHGMLRCSTFGSMDVDRRNDLVRKHKLCINCFSALHGYRQCPVRFSCKSCGGRHHTMLHRDTTPTTAPSNTPTPATPTALPSFTAAATAPTSRFLLTALVTLQNEGNTYHARAILDMGAAISFMSEAAASALHLKRTFQPLQVAGTMGEGQCKFAVSTKLFLQTIVSSLMLSILLLSLSCLTSRLHPTHPRS